MSQSTKITISPALAPDFHPIAALETLTFHHEPFSAVAFGPLRDSPTSIQRRATNLAKQPTNPDGSLKEGESNLVVKAVDEKGAIVGVAIWGFVTRSANGKETGDGEEKKFEWKQEHWGESANQRFCEDIFVKGDEIMLESCGGGDYAKLGVLVVSPGCQRQGIGSKLLEHGLKEVDKRGLQCVLAASKEALGLYKKFGFVPYHTMEIDFADYDGGEGLGTDEHVIMNRPARKL